jgi:CHAT domain-containing protein
VLADTRGDLPKAKREAELAAARFGGRPLLGPAATSTALFAATRDGSLHVAMHTRVALGAGALDLFDRPVSALEIASRSAGPRLVLLSGCASAAADDGELATSLATAFVASGSVQVIATLRPVSDDGAAELTAAFYREGGATDPARALARAQAAAATSNVDWPNFVLFGHDICRKESP